MKAVAVLIAFAVTVAIAHADIEAKKAFDALKKLERTWSGIAQDGNDKMTTQVIYKVTAAGSALVETLFPGSSDEMVTVYHLDGPRLMLTHYCGSQNQPTMKLIGHDAKIWKFDFVSGTNMKSGNVHMHSVAIKLVDPNHLVRDWTTFMKGKPAGVAHFDLHRAK